MSFQVTVILHGVPAGFKSFGKVDGQDKEYVQTFYNSNDWDEPEFLKVERVANKMFYTFIKCNNVNAYDGRSGSYLGITLRMNLYYADIQNIYSILKGVYKKLCIGTLVSDDGKQIKYLVSDFKDVGGKLEEYNKRIIDTISTFTSGSDLQAIDQVCNGKGTKCVNLMDCTESVAKRILVISNSLKVSTYYASDANTRLQSEYAYKLNQVKEQYSQELQKAEGRHNERIAELERQLEQKGIELQGCNKRLKAENSQLQKELADTKRKMQEKINSAAAKLNQVMVERQRIVVALGDIFKKPEAPLPIESTAIPKTNNIPNEKKNSPTNKFALRRVVLLLVIILLLIVTIALMWRQSTQLRQNLTSVNTRLDSLATVFQGSQDQEQPLSCLNINPNDFIIDLTDNTEPIKKGVNIEVSIKPRKADYLLSEILNNSDWNTNDQNAEIKNKGKGKAILNVNKNFAKKYLTITCNVNGKNFKQRKVEVK